MNSRWNGPNQQPSAFTVGPAQASVAGSWFNANPLPHLAGEIAQCLVGGSIDPTIAMLAQVACISMLTQGTCDVAWPNGLSSPVGINCFLTAPSGGGKSVTMRVLSDPIHRVISDLQQRPDVKEAKPMFFIEDATREAILVHLNEWRIAFLRTDEGGQLSRLFKHGAPTLAKLLDGARLDHARAGRGRIALQDHRLVMLVMAQPAIFERDKSFMGAVNGGVGLINRFMVGASALSPSSAAIHRLELPQTVRARYEERIRSLLVHTIDIVRANSSRPVLRLSDTATRRLLEISSTTHSIRTDPRFANAGEYTARHTERVLRLAGALHVFHHGVTAEVGLESIEAAHQIGLWSLDSYASMTASPPKLTQIEMDAACLEEGLTRSAQVHGPCLSLSILRRMSPNIGLTKARFDRALPLLASCGKVTVHTEAQGDWVYVNLSSPTYMSKFARSRYQLSI